MPRKDTTLRRRRKRLTIEYDNPELMRALKMITAAHNTPDVRRQVLNDIKTAHALCHPEIGKLIDAEVSYMASAVLGVSFKLPKPGPTTNVELKDGHVYITNGTDSVTEIDLSDTNQSEEITWITKTGPAMVGTDPEHRNRVVLPKQSTSPTTPDIEINIPKTVQKNPFDDFKP